MKIKTYSNPHNTFLLKKLLRYLNEKKFQTVYPIKNSKGELFSTVCHDDEYLIEISNFIDGVYYKGNLSHLDIIAKNVGKMHSVLSEYPQLDDIIRNTRNNEENIQMAYEYLKNLRKIKKESVLGSWVLKNGDYVDRLISDYRAVDDLSYEMQLIHGDLNRGNILIQEDHSNIYFLDFEDSVFSYLPIVFDLMYIIQRFILHFATDEKDLNNMVGCFFENYHLASPQGITLADNASYVLRLLSYRSTLKLVWAMKKNASWFYKFEMDKFIDLESEAFGLDKILKNCLNFKV